MTAVFGIYVLEFLILFSAKKENATLHISHFKTVSDPIVFVCLSVTESKAEYAHAVNFNGLESLQCTLIVHACPFHFAVAFSDSITFDGVEGAEKL